MRHILGIDVGTTGTKCALFNEQGDLCDLESLEYGLSYPMNGWVEQDPADWWGALCETVRAVLSRSGAAQTVTGLSLSTQGGALVLLDDAFEPLYPAVSWLDRRAEEIAGEIEKKISRQELYRMCGWPLLGQLGFPTVCWFRERRPDLFKKASYFASTVDYINRRLTGKFVIDCSNLALLEFLDIGRRGWSDKLMEIAGIGERNVPPVAETGTLLGQLTPEAAEDLGLPEKVKVISGAHDQYCAALGAGAIRPGQCVLSCGTAWVLVLASERIVADDRMLIYPGLHVPDGLFGLMTSVQSGGNALTWFRDGFLPGEEYEALSGRAAGVEPGSGGMLFIPKGVTRSGKASFLEFDTAHTPDHFVRSVMEGVAFANRERLDAFRDLGLDIKSLVMIGGGARSPVWPHIVADITGLPVSVPEQSESACAGAAMIAGKGTGLYGSYDEACSRFLRDAKTIEPDGKNREVYDALYARYSSFLEKH